MRWHSVMSRVRGLAFFQRGSLTSQLDSLPKPPGFPVPGGNDRYHQIRGESMFGKNFVKDLIDRSAENPADRRRFLKGASAAGLGVVGAGLLGSVAAPAVSALAADAKPETADAANAISDSAILNFA